MEYGSRQHGDASGVAGQLPMPLSKFQSNVISGSRTLGSVGSSSINNKHQMISEKKRMFEGQDIIVGQHQLLQVKPSLPATAATSTSGSSTASSTSSMKKFFGRNKGFVCVQLYAYVHMYVSVCVCLYTMCVCSVCSYMCLCLSV